jgi:hypothetical protein
MENTMLKKIEFDEELRVLEFVFGDGAWWGSEVAGLSETRACRKLGCPTYLSRIVAHI